MIISRTWSGVAKMSARERGPSLVAEVGVAHDDVGHRVVLELVQEVETLNTREIVEPIRILEALQLRLEDEGEGRAEHAAEVHLLLGEAAHPEVDVVEARSPLLAHVRPS